MFMALDKNKYNKNVRFNYSLLFSDTIYHHQQPINCHC